MSVNQSTTPIEYRDIPGKPGYRATSEGRIQSCWVSSGTACRLGDEWKNLAEATRRLGHKVVSVGGYALVHRLVLEAFVGPCPPGMECRHLDGDGGNNRPENLKWGTHQENEDDKKRHATRPKGSGHVHAKITEDDVREMRRLHEAGGITQLAIARRFGLHPTTVNDIVNRKRWLHV